MCSFDTSEADIDAFVAGIREELHQRGPPPGVTAPQAMTPVLRHPNTPSLDAL